MNVCVLGRVMRGVSGPGILRRIMMGAVPATGKRPAACGLDHGPHNNNNQEASPHKNKNNSRTEEG